MRFTRILTAAAVAALATAAAVAQGGGMTQADTNGDGMISKAEARRKRMRGSTRWIPIRTASSRPTSRRVRRRDCWRAPIPMATARSRAPNILRKRQAFRAHRRQWRWPDHQGRIGRLDRPRAQGGDAAPQRPCGCDRARANPFPQSGPIIPRPGRRASMPPARPAPFPSGSRHAKHRHHGGNAASVAG